MFTTARIARFRQNLLSWGKAHRRSYPWRFVDDPYAILVAEFMLHRTQTRQVQPIFEKFIAEYPTLSDYAKAEPGTVRELLYPLGLKWRVQAMIDALNELWVVYGEVPLNYEKLTSIRGIGQYIGGATICFSQNERLTLIDSNVVRVVGRVFGLELSGEARRKKSIITAISNVCDPHQPRAFYYTIIDLAHTMCTPRNPDCHGCPLLETPCAFGVNRISSLLEGDPKSRRGPL